MEKGKFNDPEIREIRQLWMVAERYFNLAKEIIKMSNSEFFDKPNGELAKEFDEEIPKDEMVIATAMFNGHLASCAIRLITINERKKLELTVLPKDIKNSKSVNDVAKCLLENIDDFIHVMLRDNVGHIENARCISWQGRQQAVEQITPRIALKSMGKVFDNYYSELKNIPGLFQNYTYHEKSKND